MGFHLHEIVMLACIVVLAGSSIVGWSRCNAASAVLKSATVSMQAANVSLDSCRVALNSAASR